MSGQKADKEVAQLEKTDPKQADSMFKASVKHRLEVEKDVGRVRFSFMGFMQEWRSTEGSRKEKVFEMMWEGEFLQFAQSVKG